jgi:hypothetical protein
VARLGRSLRHGEGSRALATEAHLALLHGENVRPQVDDLDVQARRAESESFRLDCAKERHPDAAPLRRGRDCKGAKVDAQRWGRRRARAAAGRNGGHPFRARERRHVKSALAVTRGLEDDRAEERRAGRRGGVAREDDASRRDAVVELRRREEAQRALEADGRAPIIRLNLLRVVDEDEKRGDIRRDGALNRERRRRHSRSVGCRGGCGGWRARTQPPQQGRLLWIANIVGESKLRSGRRYAHERFSIARFATRDSRLATRKLRGFSTGSGS